MGFLTVTDIRKFQGIKAFITDNQILFASKIAESEIKKCIGAEFENVKDDDNIQYAHAILTYYYALNGSYSDVKRQQDEMSPTNDVNWNEYFSPKDLQLKLDQLKETAKMLLSEYCNLFAEGAVNNAAIGGSYSYTPTKKKNCFGCDY